MSIIKLIMCVCVCVCVCVSLCVCVCVYSLSVIQMRPKRVRVCLALQHEDGGGVQDSGVGYINVELYLALEKHYLILKFTSLSPVCSRDSE